MSVKITSLEYVYIAGELGAHKTVQMAYLWIVKALSYYNYYPTGGKY